MSIKFDIGEYLKENKISLGSMKKEVGTKTFKAGYNDIRKTNYDVKLDENGKLDLYTHKELITEGVKYPDQYEAEGLVAWTNAMMSLPFAGAAEVRKAFNDAENIRIKVWKKIFGDNSPWSVETKKGNFVVKWDKAKAKKLGL